MSREPKPGKSTVNVSGTSYEFDVPDTEPEPIRCITPSEYARRTGQSAGSVRGKLRRGTIAGRKVDGEWIIPDPFADE